MNRIPYQDLHHVGENQRIRTIIQKVKDTKGQIGVLIDDEDKKVERYKRKLLEGYPELVIEGPVPFAEGSVLLTVRHPTAGDVHKAN